MPDPRIEWLTVLTVDEVLILNPWISIKSWCKARNIFSEWYSKYMQELLKYSTVIWILLDQMSQLTSFLVDPCTCSWSHYIQVPHLDNSSVRFLNISCFSMSQGSKKSPISDRYLTKKQVSTISAILADVMEQSKIDIGKTIDTKLSEDITITRCDTKVWIKTIFMENMDELLKQCTKTICNMYHDCNVGNYKDKYALLQIRWGEWTSKSLVCGTKENHAMIPDPVSSRTNTTGNGFESAHVSCVIHALCMAFFQSASDIVKSVKPNNRQNPATPILQNDSLD